LRNNSHHITRIILNANTSTTSNQTEGSIGGMKVPELVRSQRARHIPICKKLSKLIVDFREHRSKLILCKLEPRARLRTAAASRWGTGKEVFGVGVNFHRIRIFRRNILILD
jgi:hypothetical protein